MKNQQGFTLIELSIVLVIIGLIVGGVLVGQDLIRAGERHSLIGKLEQIKVAFHTFRIKYNCLPGDCNNATAFFGKSTSLCNGHSGSAGTPGTCNGNGNRRVISEPMLPGVQEEHNHSLIQLTLAEFLSYDYTGNGYAPSIHELFSWNGIRQLESEGPLSMNDPKPHYVGNVFSTDSVPKLGSCEELYFFDQAYDDGLPNTGTIKLIAGGGAVDANYCVNNITNVYKLTMVPPFDSNHFFYYRFD